MIQSVLTIVADIDPARLAELEKTLDTIRIDPTDNAILPFAQFEVLHFASFVLAAQPGLKTPKLIFESNVDGIIEDWLATLVKRAGAGLDALFGGSPGYPGSSNQPVLEAWLAERVVRPGAFHIGATGRSLSRIRQEARLHAAVSGFLDVQAQAGALKDATPASVRAQVQAFVRGDPDLSWALSAAPPRETSRERIGHLARAGAVVAGALVASPILLPVGLAAFAVLVVKEKTDPVQNRAPTPEHVQRLEEFEDRGVIHDADGSHFLAQNHLSSVIPLKPGMLRATVVPVVLYALNLVTRIKYTKGKLGGIPSIHFAHWSLIDGGRHLLFLSNFDGSWESYLADFIDKAAKGLTSVWSSTVDFPRTRFLLLDGATDGPRFRQWARCSQCRTDAWYTAYPELTMTAIDNNSAIRDDLFTKLDDERTARWLQRL